MKLSDQNKIKILNDLQNEFGKTVTRKALINHFKNKSLPVPNWLVNSSRFRLDKGNISLEINRVKSMDTPIEEVSIAMQAQIISMKRKNIITEVYDLIPARDETYIPFGFYKDLEYIVKSNMFYPLFITGLTGNGKTTMVEQVCAKLKRECIRVNISIETDEDDLVGGSTLIDGNVTFREGPVITAMRRGAILLIDEIDRGSNKLMCIQGILEGKSFFIKKTGEIITATKGFNIIATANTKGRGNDDGKYIAAQILDEAFLERFPITIEQEYPSLTIEKKIILNNMEVFNCIDEDFADKLVRWAEIIRKTYMENAIDEIISTRRLVHIVKAFSIFNDRKKAINLCIDRFDVDTKTAFLDLYQKMDITDMPETLPKEEKQII